MRTLQRIRVGRKKSKAEKLAKQVFANIERRQERSEINAPSRIINISLHGRFLFDSERSTPEHFRRFLWSALPLLRAEARAKGLSESQAQKLLVQAFDFVEDSTDGLWYKLKNDMEKKKVTHRHAEQMSIVTVVDNRQVEELRPMPEFVWSKRSYRTRKAVEEFSKETHADY